MTDFEWNHFPVREIFPESGLYAIGAKLELDKSITYLTCNKFGDVSSIRVKSIKAEEDLLSKVLKCYKEIVKEVKYPYTSVGADMLCSHIESRLGLESGTVSYKPLTSNPCKHEKRELEIVLVPYIT
jgi:hypothetical protein